MNLVIKKASLDDLKTISMLAHEIWPIAFKGIIPDDKIQVMLDEIYNLNALKKEVQEQGHIFWLAKNSNEDIAYASAYLKDETCWLKKIYIKSEMQGQGCGKALIKEVLANFPEAKKLALYVNKDNIAAQSFYNKQGFIIQREEAVTMGGLPFIDLVMIKEISLVKHQ